MSKLLTPVQIGRYALPNRLVMGEWMGLWCVDGDVAGLSGSEDAVSGLKCKPLP